MRIAAIRCTVTLVLLSAVSASVHAGAWLSDSSVGCQVWNPHQQLDETVQWSGACANGFAQGRGAKTQIRTSSRFLPSAGCRNTRSFRRDCGGHRAARRSGVLSRRAEQSGRSPTGLVMPALVAGIHVFLACFNKQGMDGRDKPGHDSRKMVQRNRNPL